MRRAELKAYLILIALLAGTCVLLRFSVNVSVMDRPGIVMWLPGQIGAWSAERRLYCHSAACRFEYTAGGGEIPERCPECGEELHGMTSIEQDVLGADTQFVRSTYTDTAGREIHVTLVLSGKRRSSIHRPQRCLVAQGYTLGKSRLASLPREGRSDLSVMALDLARGSGAGDGRGSETGTYLYWFVGQGRETPRHLTRMFWLAWDRIVHSVGHKWAYVSISGGWTLQDDSIQSFLKAFLKQWYAEQGVPRVPTPWGAP